MIKGTLKTKTLFLVLVVVITLLLMLMITLFTVPELNQSAHAAAFTVINPESYKYYELNKEGSTIQYTKIWNKSTFLPFTNPYVSISQYSGGEPSSYSWTMVNTQDSNIVYNGSKSGSTISWTGGVFPSIAGIYNCTIQTQYEGQSYSCQETLTLRGYAHIVPKLNSNFSVYYDGFDHSNLTNPIYYYQTNVLAQTINLNNFFEIDGLALRRGGLNNNVNYSFDYSWEDGTTVVADADNYPCHLTLLEGGQPISYIDYGGVVVNDESQYHNENIFNFQIKKRPLLLQNLVMEESSYVSGAVQVQKEKDYDENANAFAQLYTTGEGAEGYQYLLNATKFSANSGLLPHDLQAIIDNNMVTSFLLFDGVNQEYSSQYLDPTTQQPSSTTSQTDAQGNLIYDKLIRIYYEINPSYTMIRRNYFMTIDEEITPEDELNPATYLTFDDQGGIRPNGLRVYTRSVEKEYGVTIDSLIFQLIAAGADPSEGNIGVEYYGTTLGGVLNVVNSIEEVIDSPMPDIDIMIKVGRLFDASLDTETDIIYKGYNNIGQRILLVEYFSNLPTFIGNLYFYPEIYYNGSLIPQHEITEKHTFGDFTLTFQISTLIIRPRQLIKPYGLEIDTQKEYDGLLQASFSEYSFSSPLNQWISNDGLYLEAVIKPVFDSALVGLRQLTVEFILRLTELGLSQNKQDLLYRYKVPAIEVLNGEDVKINPRVIEFSFDMENAEDRPSYPPFNDYRLFPEDKILTFDKPLGAPLPTIKEFVFGDYEYDEFGNIVYEEAYTYKKKTHLEQGVIIYETDFYGNHIYIQDQFIGIRPKMKNSFSLYDDPNTTNPEYYPIGFDFQSAIDWRFYFVEVFEDGLLKRIEVSGYDPLTGQVKIIDANTPNARYEAIDENTLSTGEPGISIKLQEFNSMNYIFQPKIVAKHAFLRINKKTPSWIMASSQSYVYDGKQHSSMLENINLIRPERYEYNTEEEYQLALQDYQEKSSKYSQIIKINLESHEEFLEIIGKAGKGINFNVIGYARPGQEQILPINSYAEDIDIIKLIKLAGRYSIEVSLPETSTYAASEVRTLTLTIEQKVLTVLLTNTERFYAQPNPDDTNITYKEDTTDTTQWGWRLYSTDMPFYSTTIVYNGFANNEDPNSIGYGEFIHCRINYSGVDETSYPNSYPLKAYGAQAYNYSFYYALSDFNPPIIVIKPIKAIIELVQTEVTQIYDPTQEAWRVNQIKEGSNLPHQIYTYSANDNTEVKVDAVGYKPMGLSYDFSIHYEYLKDEENNLVLDINEQPIIIDFHPIIIFSDGEWIPYVEGMTGDYIRDCSVPESFNKRAKNVGQYIFMLSADPEFFEEPIPKFVKFNIDYADTIVEVKEEVHIHSYNGNSFLINGIPDETEDDNFIINNEEIKISFKVEKSTISFEDVNFIQIFDYKVFKDDVSSQIIDAGYYRITFKLQYEEGDIINYYMPDITEYVLLVEVVKSSVIISFGSEEGDENWRYRGLPYEVMDMDYYQQGQLGVTYNVNPYVSFNDIIVQIYKFELNPDGTPIEEYKDIYDNPIQHYDEFNNPIPLPKELMVEQALDAGIYLFRIKASGENAENYVDSEWIMQKFVIKKATVTVGITGAPIHPSEQLVFPEQTYYPLSKIYGEDIIETRYQLTFSGWVNEEDLFGENQPSGFINGTIDWGQLSNKYVDARPNAPYTIFGQGVSCDNYDFEYLGVAFTVYKRQGKILVNEDYAHFAYTGTDQRYIPTFRSNSAPDDVDDEIMPYAFALNHDPDRVTFSITLTAKLVYNQQTQEYERMVVSECVDVGRYIFTISATASTNYTEIQPTEYIYEIVKAELKANIQDNQIIYGDNYPEFVVWYEGFVGKDYEDIFIDPLQIPVYAIQSDGSYTLTSGENKATNFVNVSLDIPTTAINCGNYIISLYGGSAENYYFNNEDTAILAINPKAITVSGSAEYSVEKEYDGTIEADNYVTPIHYVFDGVIEHPLKSQKDVVLLTFSASFDSAEVGRRTVKMQELSINNTNYFLTTVYFECDGEIKKYNPEIKIFSRMYTYDATPKTITPQIEGLPGAQVNYYVTYKGIESTIYVESSNAPTSAGRYEVSVTTDDMNYVTLNAKAIMTINKATIEIWLSGDTMQTYGTVTGLTATAKGFAGYQQRVTVRYYDSNGQEVEDITTADTGVYTSRANYNISTSNYLPSSKEEELRIRPKTVSVSFVSAPSYLYDGKMKHQKASFYNIYGEMQDASIKYALIKDGQEIYINVDENDNVISAIAPKDAGNYKATAVAPNSNYILTGTTLESLFEITRKNIEIKVNDLTINQGDYPNFTYTIQGIVSGENINTFETRPSISFYSDEFDEFIEDEPTEVGAYRILPYGAWDNNYNITYSEGRLIINAVKLVANTTFSNGLMLEGSFSPDTNLNVKVLQAGSYSKANTSFEVFKMQNDTYKAYVLSDIYDVSIKEGTNEGDMITLKILLNPDLRGAETYNVAHIKLDGQVEIIEVSATSDNYLEFSVRELGSFAIVVEQPKAYESIWVYLAIAGAALIILIGIIIIKKRA